MTAPLPRRVTLALGRSILSQLDQAAPPIAGWILLARRARDYPPVDAGAAPDTRAGLHIHTRPLPLATLQRSVNASGTTGLFTPSDPFLWLTATGRPTVRRTVPRRWADAVRALSEDELAQLWQEHTP